MFAARAGALPGPMESSQRFPIPPSWIKGREGYEKGGKSKGGKGEEVRERMGEEGKKGREGGTLQTKRLATALDGEKEEGGRGMGDFVGQSPFFPPSPPFSSVCPSSQNTLKYALAMIITHKLLKYKKLTFSTICITATSRDCF